jgi:hypothetical protein
MAGDLVGCFGIEQLKAGGFDARQLKGAGFTVPCPDQKCYSESVQIDRAIISSFR